MAEVNEILGLIKDVKIRIDNGPALLAAAEQVGAELGLTVVNMRFVKPLDRALILELARIHEGFVTLEDNVVAGGAGKHSCVIPSWGMTKSVTLAVGG